MPAVEPKQVPGEILAQISKRRIAVFVVCTLFLTALVNGAACWYLSRWSPNVGYLLIAAKWDILRDLPGPVDLLILGDSGGNQGVDPGVLKEKLGMSSVNLCTIGDAMILNDLRMLEYYIEHHRPPEAVVIVHGYDIWSRDLNISVLSRIPGSWWTSPPHLDLGIKQKIKIRLNRYVPIYTQTTSLAQVLQNPWTAFRRNLRLEPDGFMMEPQADPEQVLKDAEVHREFVRGQRPAISEPNRRALKRICTLAREYRFDVFIANGPLFEGLYADATFDEYFAEVQAAINEIVGEYHRTCYILNPPAIFPADAMQSADHVACDAAVEYSERIAREIRILREQQKTLSHDAE